jgi:hypothetical protein
MEMALQHIPEMAVNAGLPDMDCDTMEIIAERAISKGSHTKDKTDIMVIINNNIISFIYFLLFIL